MVKKSIICQMFFLTLLATASAQDVLPRGIKERVFVITDRNLYATGETLSFSALIKPAEDSIPGKVLYCELVTPGGKQVSAGKYPIQNTKSSGTLLIPGNLFTGIYFLRAYTRFMRNEGPSSFSYVQLKIINPDRNEVEANPASGVPFDSLRISHAVENTDGLIIKADKKQVFVRDTVHIIIKPLEKYKPENLTLSVVPEGSLGDESILMPSLKTSSEKDFIYPEARGITLTGYVMEKELERPVKGIRINLSILGEGKDFMSMRTDSSGRFYFSIPGYTGYRDLFLSVEDTISLNPMILIDNDFCPTPFQINTGTFYLSAEEREAAYKIAVNSRVTEYFKDSVDSGEGKNVSYDQAFYGTPEQTLYMDKYIQLPDLEEYFNGLPAWVKVRKRHGRTYFKVLGPQTELTEFPPLVMVDLVAINDPEKILALNPRNIDRIEIVNSLYLKGDEIYGGILNIISGKGDFGGISLPSSGVFIRYEFLNRSEADRYQVPGPDKPDARNTLLWIPDLDPANGSDIPFIAPDTPGRYSIVLRGFNKNGEIILEKSDLEVISRQDQAVTSFL